MVVNKLKVNIAKNKYLLFTPRSNYSAASIAFKVNFRNNIIEKVSSICFLAVIAMKI